MANTAQQQAVIDAILDPSISLITCQAVAGAGKEQPLTSKVLTPTGWSTMGQLKVGELVCSPNGRSNTILAIHPQGCKKVYEISFSDGSIAQCGLEHLWYVSSTTWKDTSYRTLTTKELLNTSISSSFRNYYTVPLTEVSYPEAVLPIHPYVLGALLGDGSIHSNGVHLSSHVDDGFILDKCVSLLPIGTGISSTRATSVRGVQTRFLEVNGINTLKDNLTSLGLMDTYSHTKFIPKEYLISSTEQRLALLAGLMDTDGSVGKANRVTYSSTSKQLVDAICELVSSLGGLTTISTDTRKRVCYTISIKFNNINPFTLPRKAVKVTARKQNTVRKAINSITALPTSVEQQCISLDGDHLYITDGYTTTHNTYTLVEAAKAAKPKTGLYLAYNKAIADEAKEKFKGTNMRCVTMHALAYNEVVRQYGLNVGYFGVRNVVGAKLSYNLKKQVVDTIESFCLSSYTCPIKFMKDKGTRNDVNSIVCNHLDLLSTGELSCNHSFYLKFYHMLLHTGEIEVPEVELLMVDEAGDITGLTLAIFNMIKATTKVAVGDPYQNIYSFNNTINAFDVLEKDSYRANLTESFRVSDAIAANVEAFIRKTLNPSFSFIGRKYEADTVPTNKLYIARNNSGLLSEMFRLQDEGIPFHTTRKVSVILELPLIIANLDKGRPITGYKYSHIETLRKSYVLHKPQQSIQKYVAENIRDDDEFSRAYQVMISHGPTALNSLTKYANECRKYDCELLLSTAHSSKGLEMHEVEIAPDLNVSVRKALRVLTDNLKPGSAAPSAVAAAKEELRLYYVACTRAMVRLTNADVLHKCLAIV